ncbi:hypothetical protein [Streptomyces lasiicapitis]
MPAHRETEITYAYGLVESADSGGVAARVALAASAAPAPARAR